MLIRFREGIEAKIWCYAFDSCSYLWLSCPLTHSSSCLFIRHFPRKTSHSWATPPTSSLHVHPSENQALCVNELLLVLLCFSETFPLNSTLEVFCVWLQVKCDLLWMSAQIPVLITFIYPGKVDWPLRCYTFKLFNTQTGTRSDAWLSSREFHWFSHETTSNLGIF